MKKLFFNDISGKVKNKTDNNEDVPASVWIFMYLMDYNTQLKISNKDKLHIIRLLRYQ